MYKISREFSFPMGHRLSKHKGRCQFFHGHNFKVIVGLMSRQLNDNDMVMDFGDLKAIMDKYIDLCFDHSLAVNIADDQITEKMSEMIPGLRIARFVQDPTAEVIAETIHQHLTLEIKSKDVVVEYVTVYENDKSSATYTEDWTTEAWS